MIRARESLDRRAQAAHSILDQAQRSPSVNPRHVDWALAYLGDCGGSTRVPADLDCGYGSHEREIAA